LISGIPTTVQTASSQISATNAGGTGTALLSFSITPPPRLVIREIIITEFINEGCSFKLTFYNDGTYSEIKL